MSETCANEITLADAPRVLIADTLGLSRVLLRRLLEKRGYQVAETSDGAATLEAVEMWAPDLVLLSLHLPDLSGVEVLRQLRQQYDPARLPVIMVAAESDAEIAAQCYATGSNDYVLKPIQWLSLHARLQTQLKQHSAHVDSSGASGQFVDLQT